MASNDFNARLRAQLEARRAAQLYRIRREVQTPQDTHLRVNGRELLNFCGNDYLGLANDARVKAAFIAGVAKYGVGSGASHLVCGHSAPHEALEAALAQFTGRSRALVYSSGFMANVGVLTALLGAQDAVFEDRLNHASLLDGGMFSGARFKRYPHLDTAVLEHMIEKEPGNGERLVVSDGVFSMDGDVAPLASLMAVCERQRALLMIDDAHGFGCLGGDGGGLVQQVREQGVRVDAARLPILLGTLGKAFGTMGAFVAGSEELIETLIQFSRPYIYTTALPPAVASATLCSLDILRSETWRRERLRALIQRFRRECAGLGFTLTESATPIQGLLLGTAQAALAASTQLEAQGLLVSAIRPPTVPPGTARLRITFNATHTDAQLDRLLEALASLQPLTQALSPKPSPIARTRIARAFGAAAAHYEAHAALQREVAQTLCALAPPTLKPHRVLDLGCGTGYCVQHLQQHFPAAECYGLDLALPMLQQTRARNTPAQLLCADAALLPLARHSFDLLCSSLTLQWCADPTQVFAEVARVLRPGALALFSTLGPDSLRELRQAWAAVDSHTHVNHFAAEAELLQAAQAAGLQVRCERRVSLRWYRDLRDLSRELKGIGAQSMNAMQRRGLTGRDSYARAEQAFAAGYVPGRGIPVTYAILYLQLAVSA